MDTLNNNQLLNKDLHLSFHNKSGSVEHYYHFLLGFFLPLALAHEKISTLGLNGKIYIRSCALMDAHLKAINFQGVAILDKLSHSDLGSGDDAVKNNIGILAFSGYDHPEAYCYSSFENAKSIITKALSTDINSNTLRLRSKSGIPHIVIIHRDAPHSFFNSTRCEIRGAGNTRRSVENINSLYHNVSSIYPNTQLVTLEKKSLAYQIALFQSADIIIAQHGAALANLIWCKANTAVIEIHPNDLNQATINKNYFGRLSNCMKIHYQRVSQQSSHSAVNINLVLDAMNEVTHD